jgi:hypothetical protein
MTGSGSVYVQQEGFSNSLVRMRTVTSVQPIYPWRLLVARTLQFERIPKHITERSEVVIDELKVQSDS